jgi:geranylgeranyl reductase
MYDVIVSGAGPAGSKCAEVITNAGFKCALIEKDINWRKPCGGGVNAKIHNLYPQLRKLNFVQKLGIRMYSADFHKIEYYSEGFWKDTFVLDRLELDNFIRNVAVDAGAELFDKNISYDFKTKNQQKIGIKTKTTSGIKEYLGKIIVIADGMSSKLAIKSGLRKKWKTNDLGIAKAAIMEGKSNLNKNLTYIYFRAYKGYGWVFPIDDKRFNIGCGTFGEDNLNYNLNQIYNEFLNNKNIKKLLSGSDFKKIWEASYPLSGIGVLEKSLYSDNIMIIGDAAGFVAPISGEGIYPSIVSGKKAAETAINALENDDISIKALKKYKLNSDIKNIIREFKMKYSLIDFFYKNQGQNINKMFKLAKEDVDFKNEVVNVFLFNATPSKDFFSKIKD